MLKNASVEDEEDDEDGLAELEGIFMEWINATS